MKALPALIVLILVSLTLPSCYDPGGYFPEDTYNRGGGWGNNPYGGYGGGFGGRPVFGGFGGAACCNRCGHNPCRCRVASRCNRCGRSPCSCSSQHRHTASSQNIRPEDRKYRILGGDLKGKARPNDFHSLKWYHDRGYSLEKLKIETEKGTVIDRRPSSSSSRSNSSSRSSSSSSSSKKSSSSSKSSSGSSSKSSSKPTPNLSIMKR